MEIKLISNKDFLQLADLNAKMHKSIRGTDEFGATNTLVYYINNMQDFIAIGLYEGEEIKGFVTGHAIEKNCFYFSGIYVMMKYKKWIKNLIEYAFALVQEKGYSGWKVDATNDNIASILGKYGAYKESIKLCKEF